MPDINGHGDGSFTHGIPLDEPVDLVAVQADDELINALAAGASVPSAGGAFHADDQVVALLSTWRAEVVAEPIPELVDLETAVAAVKAGIPSARPKRSARARHLVSVAAAAAFLVLVGGGVTIGSATAEPDSALWPVSKVLFSERADSVEAAARASDKIEDAKQALMDGKPEQATADLAQAQPDLAKVRPQEGKDELVGVKDFLVAKAAETPPHTKVDPATLTPTTTTGEAAGNPAPTTRPSHSPRPTSSPRPSATTSTDAPEVTTGEAGATTSAPVTATQEGQPDTTTTTATTTSGMGSAHPSSRGGSSEESAPQTTS